ncbi:Sodium/calcium exchanger [Candidatus Terasakiella magnetica]|uniref:Sodium/calcium exchanger n=1 Tax=Candidatus Terasakiella magnetica TaxID=1867952 RepID=A0A1C3RM42_9PROT|nr:calcium/sodium antiporter [Candidatus Terasakiella magnetica]SCA58325.1 Sodium/calcium exchanger [Candidatus Terasakiella magnetica]
MMYLYIAIGFFLLLGGAEFLVKGSVGLARRIGVSPLVIGMTVVALGTSAPEFVVSLDAALENAAGIATGNIIGSNIANILLILGVTALIKPIKGDPSAIMRDGIILLSCSAVFTFLCAQGVLGMNAGMVLFGLFIAFLGYSYWRERHGDDPEAAELHQHEADEIESPENVWVMVLMTLGGIGAVVLGAELLVDGGTEVARQYGVSEEVIGLTMIAIGTSLPELAASGMAAIRGHTDVALGNVIGSNLFNILGVLGAVAMIQELPVAQQLLDFDLWVMMGATILLIPFMVTRWELSRKEGLFFAASYVTYIAVQAYGVERVLEMVSL